MAVARSSNAAAVKGVSHQHIQVTRVDDSVMNVEAVVGANLMVESNEPVVVVQGLQDIQIFSRQSEGRFGVVNRGQVAGECCREGWGFAKALALVIHEEKGFVFADGAAQGGAELTAAILVVLGSLQKRPRIRGFIAEVAIQRAMQVV